jgi:hypothetical protein
MLPSLVVGTFKESCQVIIEVSCVCSEKLKHYFTAFHSISVAVGVVTEPTKRSRFSSAARASCPKQLLVANTILNACSHLFVVAKLINKDD